jgi:hypothetical protein
MGTTFHFACFVPPPPLLLPIAIFSLLMLSEHVFAILVLIWEDNNRIQQYMDMNGLISLNKGPTDHSY